MCQLQAKAIIEKNIIEQYDGILIRPVVIFYECNFDFKFKTEYT